jgi:hypothetical protein
MVGHGMMWVWHSDALKRVPDCQLHTVVGRPPSPSAEPTHGRRGEENAQLIGPEFVHAVRVGREPAVPGWSVLPAMRVLHRAQENWDAKYGQQVLPGRPVT